MGQHNAEETHFRMSDSEMLALDSNIGQQVSANTRTSGVILGSWGCRGGSFTLGPRTSTAGFDTFRPVHEPLNLFCDLGIGSCEG